jgi:hypothetical protein
MVVGDDPGAVNKAQGNQNSVNRWIISEQTCSLPEDEYTAHEVFVFFMPLDQLRPNAVVFSDVINPDHNTKYVMFSLFIRFAKLMIKVCETFADNQVRGGGGGAPRGGGGGGDGGARRRGATNDTDDLEGTLGGAGGARRRRSEHDENNMVEDIINNMESIGASAGRDSDITEHGCEMMVETVMHDTEFVVRDSTELKDRKVLGYRFWLFNYNQRVRGNVIFSILMKYIRDTSQKLIGGLIPAQQAVKIHAWYRRYFMLDDLAKLSQHASSALDLAARFAVPHSTMQLVNSSNPLSATSLFNPTWLQWGKCVKSIYAPQRTNYCFNMEPEVGQARIVFKIPTVMVRKLFIRVLSSDFANEFTLHTRILPHLQRNNLVNISKMMPNFFEHMDQTSYDATSDGIDNALDQPPPPPPPADDSAAIDARVKDLETSIAQLEAMINNNDEHQTIASPILTDTLAEHRMMLRKIREGSRNAIDVRLSTRENVMMIMDGYNRATAGLARQWIEQSGGAQSNPLLSAYTSLNIEHRRSATAVRRYIENSPAINQLPKEQQRLITREFMMLLERRSLEEYQASCLDKLSPSGTHIVDFCAADRIFEAPPAAIAKTALDLTPFQYWETLVPLFAEVVYSVVSKHGLVYLLWKNSLDAHRQNFNSVHQHDLLWSRRGGDSKSFIQNLLHEHMLVPGSSAILAFSSLKSRAIDGNLNDSIIMFDEVPATMIIGDESSSGGNNPNQDAARMTKSLMSLNVIVAEVLTIGKDGTRSMRRLRCESICVFHWNTNIDPTVMSSSMKRRLLLKNCDEMQNPPRNIMEMQAAAILLEHNSTRIADKPKVDRLFRTIHVMVFHVEKLICVGALPQVSTDACEIILLRVANELIRHNYPEPNPSMWERIRVAARLNCIIDAILNTWFIDGAQYANKPIEFTQFRAMAPRLWINAQHVIKALADHWETLVDPLEMMVKRALIEIHDNKMRNNAAVRALYKPVGAFTKEKNCLVDPSYIVFPLGSKVNQAAAFASHPNGANNRAPNDTNTSAFGNLVTQITTTIARLYVTSAIPSKASIASVLSRWSNNTVSCHEYELYYEVKESTESTVAAAAGIAPHGAGHRTNSGTAIAAASIPGAGAVVANNDNIVRNMRMQRNFSMVDADESRDEFDTIDMSHHLPLGVGLGMAQYEADEAIINLTTTNTNETGASAPAQCIVYKRNSKGQYCLHQRATDRLSQAAMTVTQNYIYIHRDQLCQTVITPGFAYGEIQAQHRDRYTEHHHVVADPRDQIIEFVREMFSLKYQMPHMFAFDNDSQTPKTINFIKCSGPSATESRVLAFRPASHIDRVDSMMLPQNYVAGSRAAPPPSNNGSDGPEPMIVKTDIDSECMARHNTRINYTGAPVPRELFNIVNKVDERIRRTQQERRRTAAAATSDQSAARAPQRTVTSFNDVLFGAMAALPDLVNSDDETIPHDPVRFTDDDVYDVASTGGYFVGCAVNKIFSPQTVNMSTNNLTMIHDTLRELNDDAQENEDPLMSDADFNAAHFWVAKHNDPTAPPEFHTYAWDVIAEREYNSGHRLPAARFKYEPAPPKTMPLADMDDVRIAEIVSRRRESFRFNIPRYKTIHTHPLVTNDFLNSRITNDPSRPTTFKYFESQQQQQEAALRMQSVTRLARWEANRNYREPNSTQVQPAELQTANMRQLYGSVVQTLLPVANGAANTNTNNNAPRIQHRLSSASSLPPVSAALSPPPQSNTTSTGSSSPTASLASSSSSAFQPPVRVRPSSSSVNSENTVDVSFVQELMEAGTTTAAPVVNAAAIASPTPSRSKHHKTRKASSGSDTLIDEPRTKRSKTSNVTASRHALDTSLRASRDDSSMGVNGFEDNTSN